MVGQRGAVLGSGTTGSLWRARRRLVKRGRRAPAHEAREKFKVGCPSTGGLWVAEFDTAFASVNEEDNLLPAWKPTTFITIHQAIIQLRERR